MDPERGKELPRPMKKFYKGEPMALGITQILLGILTTMFGVVLNVGYDMNYYFDYINMMTSYWTGVPFIISGSLSVAAARNPKLPLVKGMLGMNVVGSVAAGIAIIIIFLALDVRIWNYQYDCSRSFASEVDPHTCREIMIIPYRTINGIMVVLLLFSFLEFFICISSAIYGCKIICNQNLNETVLVVYQSAPPKNADGGPVSGRDVLNH